MEFRQQYIRERLCCVDERDLYELELCIKQHGEAARELFDQAAVLEDMCLLPSSGFDPVLESAVNEIIGGRDMPCHGIVDIAVFAKSSGCRSFDKELIDTRNAAHLFWFTTELYEYVYPEYFESWNESEILTFARLLNQEEFCEWMRNEVSQSDNPPDQKHIEILLEVLIPKLFTVPQQEISRYCTTSSDKHLLPYIFVGTECFLIVAKGQR